MMHVVTWLKSRLLVLLLVLCGALGGLSTQAKGAGLAGDPCEADGVVAGRGVAGRGVACRLCRGACQGAVEGGEVNATRCGMPAPAYPAPFATPRPTVPTYYTYPPMMPHNSLHHYRGTYSYQHAEGLSRTNVHWRSQKGLNALRYLHHAIELPR